MKVWMKEFLIGFILLIIGIVLSVRFLGEVVEVILGLMGPLLLILGLVVTLIGYEDKKLEREIKKIEEELDKEILSEKDNKES